MSKEMRKGHEEEIDFQSDYCAGTTTTTSDVDYQVWANARIEDSNFTFDALSKVC